MLIDSHVHLDDKRFDKDRDELIACLNKKDVEFVINIGADLKTSKASVELAQAYPNVYAAVGVHPHDAKDLENGGLDSIRALTKETKVVAIGEIGLDYYYDHSPRDIQKKWFIKQLELALELDLPVVIHSRDAHKDTQDILTEFAAKGLRAVLHAFSGSVEIMKEYIKLGFYISIGGPVTFKNARVVKEVAKEVPLEKLFLETDCPYLTPEPFRGKRNEPSYTKYVAEEIAKLKGIDVQQIIEQTSNNVKRFFAID